MRGSAVVACLAIAVLCAACAAPRTGEPDSIAAAVPARGDPQPGAARLADVASRITLALDDLCACRAAPDGDPAAFGLCGYPIRIETAAEPQASTNGRRIRITSGMLRFFADDAELAFVLAHELSHLLLDHAGAFAGRPPEGFEAAADRLGIQIVSRAAFDTAVAADFPERLARRAPAFAARSGAAHGSAQRAAMIRSALATDAGRLELAKLAQGCRR